ncbi:hypothetical protein [Aliiglaciecola sp. LCG003]|uniref:hypothetical protein n=1 Tax=Aliiglaciecola sp. LCG003 TaxID=3053655 RepID=UPI0025723411|nr:hypothetical protein [Aliiglaciecola sp. LCG003]WJG09774.1 hypothetical protein QR722_01675 [Aliiglaciecola sp. LCG003]
MQNKQFETDLRDKVSKLEKSKLPERDLWPGIEIALANDLPTSQSTAHIITNRPKIYAYAASILVVGLISWFVVMQKPTGLAQQDLVSLLSNQHQQQKQALLVKFQDQPALTENWQTQLTELDDAAIAIKAALKQDPDNIALLKMLQNVHQQQINLIERVHSPKWRQI